METTELIIVATAVLLTAVFGPLGGAILATGVGIWWQKQREIETQKAQSQAVRFLISLEVEKNLTAFWHFWRQVCDRVEGVEADIALTEAEIDLSPVQQLHLLEQFITLPLPEWQYRVLDSQLPMLPRAFSDEKERVRQIFDLRAELDTITDMHAAVSGVWSRRPAGVKIIPVIGLASDNAEGNSANNREIELLEADMLQSWQALDAVLKRLWQRRKTLLNQ